MNIKKLFINKNGLLPYGFVLFVVSSLLTQLPLTNTFGYEFSVINGLLLSVLAGLQTLNFLRKTDFVISRFIKNLLILFLIPFLVIFVHSILTMFCSFVDGLIFYVLIVGTSILFGTAIAFLSDIIAKKYERVLFFIVIFFTALIPILEIYFNPQVFFYSPLIGFFPGNIYDEGLSADWKLFFHQVVVTAFSLSIIFLFLKRTTFVLKYKFYFMASIILTIYLFQYFSTSFGFSTTFAKLNSILPKQIESEALILHFDDIDSIQAQLIALNQEYYFLELLDGLKTKPSKKINVYLFNNREQKKTLFGAGNADVAKPWQYSIYISADSWQNTLKHELAHIFTAEFGSGIFKIASGFNPALIEGMAESQDPISNDISIKYLTKVAYNNGYTVDLKSLFTGLSFFKGNSTLAYIYSGAFIDFLINKYGIEKVKKFYGTGGFDSVFKNKIETVQKEFFQDLSFSDSINTKPMADYYFGRLSIIQKVCPRYIGDRLKKGYLKLSENKFNEAEKIFNEINQKTINYSALVGLSEIFLKQNKIDKAINILEENIKKFNNTPYYANISLRLGDLYSINLNDSSSCYCYKKIIIDNPNHQLNYLCKTRLSLLQVNELKNYLEGSDSLKLKILFDLNNKSYNYNSIPIVIGLLNDQKIKYKEAIKTFNKTFVVDNIESSYAAFKLSEYMLYNKDYINARKYAALSLRVKDKNIFYTAMQQQFKKTDWFYKNANRVLQGFVYDSYN
ncbi:MAG: hypothetical protein IPJ23_02675 [Ignavibacteriales bacterium]|nr:hypothetical protein [Ignavibacteriales bacterium]